MSGCQNLCHNTDRLYQSAPTGLLAGYRPRSPTVPDSSLTPDRPDAHCRLRSLPQRVVTTDRFTSCHNQSLHQPIAARTAATS
ncbi:MAG: hypothetical protein HC769_32350 [Cyanobacteria bacterium CRU_2_1]|nr:hypothetical protein [Cyanobacteria bacterium CRU_2_1]